ncbi:hypothetical protein MBLNU457_g0260t1 [Dothideomycetes sp. NU457]
MPPLKIIDSHIHLWPASAANTAGHSWMSPDFILTKQHLLADYFAASDPQSQKPEYEVQGVVYIETDRTLLSPEGRSLSEWAAQPLEEIRFLRSIVEGEYGERDSRTFLALIPWAPMDQGVAVFEGWLKLAEETAGPKTWERVKGFRFLLQAIVDECKFRDLVLSDDFVQILRSFRTEDRDFVFEVGINQHEGGVWQMEALAEMLKRVNAGVSRDRQVTIILNHLCKPNMTGDISQADMEAWCTHIRRFAAYPKVYMKLSGGFSELGKERLATTSAEQLATKMKPWLNQVFDAFPVGRIMFGSDWPVCNVRGPATEKSWSVWRDVVSIALEQEGLDDDYSAEKIWAETAKEAYRIRA